MYLAKLNEKDKKTFLSIAHIVAKSNGVYEESEKKVLKQFENEMGVDFDVDEIVKEGDAHSIETLVPSLSDIESKRIVFMESLILAYANDDFDDVQQGIIKKMQQHCRIDSRLYTLMSEWAKNVLSLNAQGNALLDI